jgi:pSer/pThr/pTyr-binding forkhead associated (FHA) protein
MKLADDVLLPPSKPLGVGVYVNGEPVDPSQYLITEDGVIKFGQTVLNDGDTLTIDHEREFFQ